MNPPRKVISVVTPCYNEEANVIEVMKELRQYSSQIPVTVMSTFSSLRI